MWHVGHGAHACRRSMSHARSPSHAQQGTQQDRHPSFDMRRRGSVESARSHAQQAGVSQKSLDVAQPKAKKIDESEDEDAVAELNSRLIEEVHTPLWCCCWV